MKIVTSASEIPSGCAFVPTMGALHAGHAALFHKASQTHDVVASSIFVNPLQFESDQDLARYPRTPDRDIELAAATGVTHLWLPRYEEIYPNEVSLLSAGALGNIYEGASRPGHFDGVVTVVRRLFDLIKPQYAIFGEKDFQQLTLIRKIAENVEIIAVPTVREIDGLAMSSRNVRLSETGRAAAPTIFQALTAASTQQSLQGATLTLHEVLRREELFTLDYADIIDESDFSPAVISTQKKRAIVAGWIDGVRLIDNMAMTNVRLA
jgi:pantoate--beta-alanine ligase